MDLLITGANGYVASNFIECLKSKQDINIYAVVRTSHKGQFVNKGNIRYLYCDMDDYGRLPDLVDGKVDCCIHFAWVGARGDNNRNYEIQNSCFVCTQKLFHAMVSSGCDKFIQIGSLAEYGVDNYTLEPVNESTLCKPKTEYARIKYATYEWLKQQSKASNVKLVEIRLGSVYGPGMLENTLLGYLINNLLAGNDVHLSTSCLKKWEFINIIDVCAVIKRMLYFDIDGDILILSLSEGFTLRDYIDIVREASNSKASVYYPDEDVRQYGNDGIWCDTTKLRSFMTESYEFTDFNKGVRSLLNNL